MTITSTVSAEQLEALAANFCGELLRPGDDGYDAARCVHNGLIDRHPALIARCTGTADVAAAVGSPAKRGSRCRSAAAVTTSPAGRSPRAA